MSKSYYTYTETVEWHDDDDISHWTPSGGRQELRGNVTEIGLKLPSGLDIIIGVDWDGLMLPTDDVLIDVDRTPSDVIVSFQKKKRSN